MRAFEILGLSIFSDVEKVNAAYDKRIKELSANKQRYSTALYEKKTQELNTAKDECISYLSSTSTDRIKKQVVEAYNYHKKENVLHDCGLWCSCTSCFSPECYEFGAADSAGSIFGSFCCIDSLVCSPAALALYLWVFGWGWLARTAEYIVKCVAYCTIYPVTVCIEKIEIKRQERKKRRLVAKRTKEIRGQAKFLDKDIVRWKKLLEETPCTVSDINCFDKLLRLIEKTGVDFDADMIQEIRKSLAWHRERAEEKQKILNRAQKVAQLYREIENPQAAETLLNKYEP